MPEITYLAPIGSGDEMEYKTRRVRVSDAVETVKEAKSIALNDLTADGIATDFDAVWIGEIDPAPDGGGR